MRRCAQLAPSPSRWRRVQTAVPPVVQRVRHVSVSPRATVAVGISGGVDSSVTAWLLQQRGFRVVGIFMRNWDSSDERGAEVCTQTDDLASAEAVAKTLRIPLHTVDFVAEYWNNVFVPFLDGYAAGITPNPDVLCNRFVKFGAFRQHVEAVIRAEYGPDTPPLLATGHYARLSPPIVDPQQATTWDALPLEHRQGHPSGPALVNAVDRDKDQSDFLALVRGHALKRVLFPLGGFPKTAVRSMAAAAGLPTASRRDSQGICFIGKRNLTEFLSSYMSLTQGEALDIETGVAMQLPAAFPVETYTIGQRARFSGAPQKFFVVGIDRARGGARGVGSGGEAGQAATAALPAQPRRVYVTRGSTHPALFADTLLLEPESFSWVAGAPPASSALSSALAAAAARAKSNAPLRPPLQQLLSFLPGGVSADRPLQLSAVVRAFAAAATASAAGSPSPCLDAFYRLRHRHAELGEEPSRCVPLLAGEFEHLVAEVTAWNARFAAAKEAADEGAAVAGAGEPANPWRVGQPPRVKATVASPSARLLPTPHPFTSPLVSPLTPLLALCMPQPQRAIAAGQIAVLYGAETEAIQPERVELLEGVDEGKGEGEEPAPPARVCLGGGAVLAAGPTLWDLGLPAPGDGSWRA